MKRFGQLMIGLVVATMWTAQTAHAQPAPASWSVQGDLAATFGNSSSSAFGGEIDRSLSPTWGIALEGGRMTNITSSSVEDRANIIGTQIGATANPTQSASYFDVGLRYHLMPEGKWNPYVTVGLGGARVKTSTTFSVNGAVLTDDELAARLVALGADLDGRINKPLLVIGLGVDVPVKERFFLGGSFRYGRIFARTGEIDGDKATNTLRLQIGLGVRF
jgi:opacity protein-like surface antigen